jgi:hypothetical protein
MKDCGEEKLIIRGELSAQHCWDGDHASLLVRAL